MSSISALKQALSVLKQINESSDETDYSELIKFMNEDITNLYRAVIQYNNHAALIKGAEWMGYIQELQDHALDDMAQAVVLCDKVVYYGGEPSTAVSQVSTAKSTEEMVKLDEQIQKEAVETYRKRAKYCEDCNLPALVKLYQDMAEHEEDHHNITLSYLDV